MNADFDINQWAATAKPYEPPNPQVELNHRGDINWRKYLRWTLACLAPVVLGICISQRFRAQRYHDPVATGIDIGNEPLNEIDVTAVTDVKDVTDVTECLWILSSASSIDSFPLLLPVNKPLHQGVLNELLTGALDHLVHTQTEVSLSLIHRAPNLNEHLAQAAKVFTHSDYSTVAFQTDINLACKQLQEIYSLLDSLTKIYYGVKGTYVTLNATTASTLEEVKLNNQTAFLSFAQSWGASWIWEPYSARLEKASKEMEKIRLGFIALEEEVTRLEQIMRVIHLLNITLQDLSTSIHRWHTEYTPEAQRNYFPRKVREWFQQNFVYNHQLKMAWVELLASVNRGEQKIHLEISHEWCNRSRQASLGIDSG